MHRCIVAALYIIIEWLCAKTLEWRFGQKNTFIINLGLGEPTEHHEAKKA